MTATSTEAPRATRAFLPLGLKVAGRVVLIVLVVALGAYFGLVSQARSRLIQAKVAAADMVVQLSALSVAPAVVFGDEAEMKRVVDDLAKNPDVVDVELSPASEPGSEAARSSLVMFHREGSAVRQLPRSLRRHRSVAEQSIDLVEPVLDPQGQAVGSLGVRFSTKREALALEQLADQVLLVALGLAFLLAASILITISRIVIAPIRKLQLASDQLARGSRDRKLLPARRGLFDDEVGRLASAFGDMAAAVADREERLAVRNGELKLILDSVEQGFLTALPDGTLREERSAIVESWVGPLEQGATIWDLVGRIDERAAEWMKLGWEQVVEDLLPLEVTIDQLTKRLTRDGRYFDLAYHPILVHDKLHQIVIVITDVTAEVERQQAMADQHEFSVLVDRFVTDRHAFVEFWEEASQLVRRVARADSVQHESLRRDLHTLKGNARFYGLARLSSLCHDLETSLGKRGDEGLTEREVARLVEAWRGLRRRVDPLTHGAVSLIEITEEEYQKVREGVAAASDLSSELSRFVRSLRFEPTRRRFLRAQDLLEATCHRLGKTKPEVLIDDGQIRLPSARWAPFWRVFSHVINNAADHGIEPDERRLARSKRVPAKVSLSSRREGDRLVVSVSDDGEGIDWGRVREAAAARGMPHDSVDDLSRALLSEGFSLSDAVTLVSGRGVGLAAVDSVVKALGGRTEVDTELGRGTTWRFSFAAVALDQEDSEVGGVPSTLPPARSEAGR